MTLEPVFSWILALGGALLLTLAATQKLRRWRELAAIVENYRIVPATLAPVAATFVTLCELSGSLLLLLPATRSAGATAAALLFTAYAAAIALNLIRGRTHIDCGCVGASKRRSIGAWMVWRNGTLAAAAALTALPIGVRALSALDVFTIAGSLAALVLLYATFDQLGTTSSRTRTAS